MISDVMIKRLPPFMRKSTVYKELFEAEGRQLSDREAVIADFQAQLSVDTATWALSVYEAELGIKVEINKSYGERRAIINSKWRGTGKVDQALLKIVASSWTGGTIGVNFESSTITITFTDLIGIPVNINAFKVAVEEITPAHLAVIYVFLYNTWAQVATKTWAELESHTWEQVLSENIF